MKFQAMKDHEADYPIAFMCRAFDVSKSGYYEWLSKTKNRDEKAKQEQKLAVTIEAIHLGSKRKYGSPNVTPILQGLGFDLSQSTVARRMKKHGIRSKLKRKFKATTDSDHKLPVAPNLLMQDFTAYRPDQIWMSDITYVHAREGWLYVCAIIDLFSKKIVSWTASCRMTQDLVIATFLKAYRDRSPNQNLIFHSDRGSQYASRAFRHLLRRLGVLQSMSRRACCWDSAPIESFWGRLKTECVFWEDFAKREDALHVIRDWIESDYNLTRPHSSIERMSPNQFEEQFTLASQAVNE